MAKNIKRTKTGEILVSLRNKYNYKQYQVANLIGISPEVYRNYETRTPPPLPIVIKLSNLYCVSCDYILGNTTNEYAELSQKSIPSGLTLSSPILYNQPENEYDLSGLPEDIKMLVEGYLNSSDTKKQALLILATEP